MADYNWCHGPKCHERQTTTRVRGTGNNKVLRTRKIAMNHWNSNSYWQYFCDQTCLMNFMSKHYEQMVQLHPRTECLETPINISKKQYRDYHDNPYERTEIEIDNNRHVG